MNVEDIYDDSFTEMNSSLYDTDYDEVGFDPIEVDDSDEESAIEYGY